MYSFFELSLMYSFFEVSTNRLFVLAAIPGGYHREFILSQMLFNRTND